MEVTEENKAKALIEEYKALYYPAPVLKTWKPTDFDRKFYNTEKKFAREAEKRNAVFHREFEREDRNYKEFLAECDTIVGLGAVQLREFFADTIQRIVEEVKSRRAKIRADIDAFRAKYDRKVSAKFKDGMDFTFNPTEKCYELFTRNFDAPVSRYYGSRRFSMFSAEQQKPALRDIEPTHYDRICLDAFCPDMASKMAFRDDYMAYENNRENLKEMATPGATFIRLVGRLAEICKTIATTLGGEPDGCTFDAGWGVGGYFNGIVVRGDKRASFKSFFAGGYNIQRLHIRFRITLLKG